MEAIVNVLSSKAWTLDNTSLTTRHSLREKRRGLQILLAEDNVVNQRLAVHLLESHDHHVTIANNGREALELIEKQPFDLVLADVQMPEMDGLQLTAAIREKEKNTATHLPIIAMTAYAMKGDRERCLKAGMDDYVSKPIDSNQLFATISRMRSDALSVPPEVEPASVPVILDEAMLMSRFEGEPELLEDIVRLFLDDCPEVVLRHSRGAGARRCARQWSGQRTR